MIEYFTMCRYWTNGTEDIGLLAHDKDKHCFAMYIDTDIVAKEDLNPILFGVSQDLAVSDRLIKLWIDARTIPEDRENIGAIMESYSISSYDGWELLKTANGRNPGYDNWGFYAVPEDKVNSCWRNRLIWR